MRFNLFPDEECRRLIVTEDGIQAIVSLLDHDSHRIIEDSIATLLLLDSTETHSSIFSAYNQSKVEKHKNSSNPVLRNWAQVFLETDQNVNLPSTSSHSSK